MFVLPSLYFMYLAVGGSVDQITVVSTVGNREQKIVRHGFIRRQTPVLDGTGIDVCLREGPTNRSPIDQKLTSTRGLDHDVGQVSGRCVRLKKKDWKLLRVTNQWVNFPKA